MKNDHERDESRNNYLEQNQAELLARALPVCMQAPLEILWNKIDKAAAMWPPNNYQRNTDKEENSSFTQEYRRVLLFQITSFLQGVAIKYQF